MPGGQGGQGGQGGKGGQGGQSGQGQGGQGGDDDDNLFNWWWNDRIYKSNQLIKYYLFSYVKTKVYSIKNIYIFYLIWERK